MSKLTFCERLCRGLEAEGQAELPRAGKYRKFTWNNRDDEKLFYFVGPNGALRKGKNASTSWSLGDPQRQTTPYKRLLNHTEPPTLDNL